MVSLQMLQWGLLLLYNMTFAEAKIKFDETYENASVFNCFLSEHLTFNKTVSIRKMNGTPNEQYYKWQFLYSLIHSGLYAKDYIGTEINFPKGNKSSASLKIDAAIFDDVSWFEKYCAYHHNNDMIALEWLHEHLLVAIEFKKEDNKNIQEVWNKQLRSYLKESTRQPIALGMLYDTERLYIFRQTGNIQIRFSDEYNQKGDASKVTELSLHLSDPYSNIPSFDNLISYNLSHKIDLSSRTIEDLDIITGVRSTQVNDAMSAILRTMDKVGLVNESGFQILIQILSIKIFDEKENERTPSRFLKFYITPEEREYSTLADYTIQSFLSRFKGLLNNAQGVYRRILKDRALDFKNESHIKILIEIVSQFQNYSFVRSHKTDLYQLVFYKFASPFSKDKNAQFVTPLPIIDFLVKIVNPRNGETVIDPTVGIADFLSVSYVNSHSKLDDNNIYGLDIDEQMVMLATLNMLLNGDGNAKIKAKPGYGSLLTKYNEDGEFVDLIPNMNANGNWDNRPDNNIIKKFDVVLTNPPFGDDRAFIPKDQRDIDMIGCYELWHRYGKTSNSTKKKNSDRKIDLGVVFLENAYRILKENGRLGIVLSNSIASIDAHEVARRWLMEKMRIVAIFDLPPNVFAETGVNTSIIVAYKPSEARLSELKKQDYQVFFKEIINVGYEVKTSKRVKYFSPIYRVNYDNFTIMVDNDGAPVLLEDFSETITEFREWCLSQENELQYLFIKER